MSIGPRNFRPAAPGESPTHVLHGSAVLPVASPARGPGTELRALLAQLGLKMPPGCDCAARAAEMDRQGPAWCRANRDLIAGWLRKAQARVGWAAWASALVRAVASGVAFAVNPLDPVRGLIDEAIRRAEAKR